MVLPAVASIESLPLLSCSSRPDLTSAIQSSLATAFSRARAEPSPYPHWLVSEVFPAGLAASLRKLPFAQPRLDAGSGKREMQNDQRQYFDAVNNGRFDLCAAISGAFQSSRVVAAIEAATGVDLAGSFVRLEYAQDTDGFWLEPHTDLGVKRFTMLIYLPESEDQADLGTDLYSDDRTWARRPPFRDNSALVFIPGSNTWHGLARRPIAGVRKSVIMNYVTADWRERGQLAFPTLPVRA